MVVEQKNGAITVDLGPKRLPLVEADAKDVVAWRGKQNEVAKLGDLLAVRLAPDGDCGRRSRSARRCRAR